MASYRYERDIRPEDLIPDQPPQLTPAQRRANWWHYHWYYVALLLCAALAAGAYLWHLAADVEPDYTVTVVSRLSPEEALLDAVEEKLTALAADENGDGQTVVEVKGIWLDLSVGPQNGDLYRLMESSQEALNIDFYLCESAIFLVDDPAGLERAFGCFRLLDGADPAVGDAVRVQDFALPAEDTALQGLPAAPEGGSWYLARRITEGAEGKPALVRGDRLWARLTAPD